LDLIEEEVKSPDFIRDNEFKPSNYILPKSLDSPEKRASMDNMIKIMNYCQYLEKNKLLHVIGESQEI